MNLSHLVLALGLAIGFLHLRDAPSPEAMNPRSTVDGPTGFEGQALHPIPLSELEQGFARSFPGTIAHYQSGDRQVIFRRVHRGTRKLHSSATCLRAAGFEVRPLGTETHHGTPWAVYRASRADRTLQVREQIRSVADPGVVWTEMSRWFWSATFHPDKGPWSAITVLESL